MVTQTSSRGSVFDVGALFEIAGNDVNRALFRHVLYSRMGQPQIWQGVKKAIESDSRLDGPYRSQLLEGVLEECCARGARTHHEGMLDAESGEVVVEGIPAHPGNRNVVRRYQILKPERREVLGAHLFDYSLFHTEDRFVVPLEYIVRFGMTSSSSVFRKYQSLDEAGREVFARELGVSGELKAWDYLAQPVGDFTTKFEPEDRMLSKQEALVTSGLKGDLFSDSGKMAILGAWAVRLLVGEIGLLLWDIKWEFAKDGDDLVFVDTIDTDSIRATLFLDYEGERYVTHYNKQAMRDYFSLLHGDWIADIKEAKAKGQSQGVNFTEILAEGQQAGRYAATPEVDSAFLEIQVKKLSAIRDYMAGTRDAATVQGILREAGLEEVRYYLQRGCLDGFRKINGLS